MESTNLGIHPYMRKCLWMYKFLEEFKNSIWAKIYKFKCIGVKRKSLTLWPLPMATQLNAKWDFKAVTSLAGNGGADEWILGFPSCVECCQRHTFLTHTIYCSKSGVSREEGGDGEQQMRYTKETAAKSLRTCSTLCDPIDGSPPGSPIPGKNTGVGCHFLFHAWKWKVKVKLLSHVWLLATSWTAAYQTPPSMGFSRQKYWNGVPLPSLTKNIKRK